VPPPSAERPETFFFAAVALRGSAALAPIKPVEVTRAEGAAACLTGLRANGVGGGGGAGGGGGGGGFFGFEPIS